MRTGSLALALGAGALIAAAPAWSAPADDAGDGGAAEARSGGTRAHLGPRAPRPDTPTANRAQRQVRPAAVQDVSRGMPAVRAPAATQAAAKADAAANPVAVLLFNQTPSLHPTRTGQDSASVVTGDLTIDDPDSSVVSYTITGEPARGTVVVDADGRYTYTPYAAYARIGTTDTFTVSVSDAASGFHLHGIGGLLNLLTFGLLGDAGHTGTAIVAVVVDPRNTAPKGTARVADPDPATGTVTGQVSGSDADGDPLTYTGPTATAKGTVSVAADGTFSYIPTAVARHDAASAFATAVDRTDSFTVTVKDGYGGTADVPLWLASQYEPYSAIETQIYC